MTGPTVGQRAPAVNANIDDGPLIPPPVAEDPPDRFLRRGELWAVPDLLRKLKISPSTWTEWRAAGLRSQMPRTKSEMVLTDWVIDFLDAHTEYDTTPHKKA
jgi:hypothetical protein